MKSRRLGILTLAVAAILGGCASDRGPQEDIGMVIGGILGGIGGSQIGHGKGTTAAIIIGTLAGAAIGGSIGHSMDETDQLKAGQTLETVRTGVSSTWHNPDTGYDYTVTPTRTYETTRGPCREYTIDARIGGKREQVYGTACRQADGSWEMQN